MFELYFHLFSSFQDPDAIKCNLRFQSLRALANPWAVGHPLIYMPSYVGTLLYIPSYALLYIPTYTPSYPYPLMYVYLFYWLAKSLGTLLYIPSYTVFICICRFFLLANPWAAYYFIYPSLAWGSSYYCRCIYVY